MDHTHLDLPEWLEHSKRATAWFNNPEKNKIRAKAKRIIKKRIGEIVEPLGFSPIEYGTGWEIKKFFVRRGIYIQASQSGDCCYFNFAKTVKYKGRFLGKREVKRLGYFYEGDYDRVGERGSLYYYDVEHFPMYIELALDVIEKQAVPWLIKSFDLPCNNRKST